MLGTSAHPHLMLTAARSTAHYTAQHSTQRITHQQPAIHPASTHRWMYCLSMTLRAYCWPVARCRASTTCEKLPSPMRRISSKSARVACSLRRGRLRGHVKILAGGIWGPSSDSSSCWQGSRAAAEAAAWQAAGALRAGVRPSAHRSADCHHPVHSQCVQGQGQLLTWAPWLLNPRSLRPLLDAVCCAAWLHARDLERQVERAEQGWAAGVQKPGTERSDRWSDRIEGGSRLQECAECMLLGMEKRSNRKPPYFFR